MTSLALVEHSPYSLMHNEVVYYKLRKIEAEFQIHGSCAMEYFILAKYEIHHLNVHLLILFCFTVI